MVVVCGKRGEREKETKDEEKKEKTQKNLKKTRNQSGGDLALLREDAPAVRRRGRCGDGAEPAGESEGSGGERERREEFFLLLFVSSVFFLPTSKHSLSPSLPHFNMKNSASTTSTCTATSSTTPTSTSGSEFFEFFFISEFFLFQ